MTTTFRSERNCNPQPDKEAVADFSEVKVGTLVTILIPNGIGRHGQEWKEKAGRVVIRGRDRLVLNMGGRFGTPGVCTAENFVRIGRAQK